MTGSGEHAAVRPVTGSGEHAAVRPVTGSGDRAAARPSVVAFGTYDLQAHPRAAVLIEGLRAHGFPVAECNAALGLSTQARVSALQRPWVLPGLAAQVVARWVRLWRLARRIPTPGAVLVPYMGHFDVHLARARFRRTPIVLDHLISASDTARDRRVSGPLRHGALMLVDAAALRAADVVVVDTEEHLEGLPVRARSKALVVPVGATDAWAAPEHPTYGGGRPLRVIFFGLFTPLQGAVVIGRALGLLGDQPRLEVTMVGDGQDLEEARRAAPAGPWVHWRGPVPPDELPSVVAAHDVCLGIFGGEGKALRVVPNKVYQGLRAGCAVVTSDTPPQRRLLGDAVVYVRPGDARALADALAGLAASPSEVARYQTAARALAERISPSAVVAPLVERLEGLATRDGRRSR